MNLQSLTNICDCHFHVFGNAQEYPFAEGRSYTPEPASLDAYLQRVSPLSIHRHVFVQPSVYGTDNRCHLDALAEIQDRARAVLVLEPDTSENMIQSLHDRGVRGVRMNFLFSGGPNRAMLTSLAPLLRKQGWHLQLLIDVATLPNEINFLTSLEIPLVFDHFGHFTPGSSDGERGFELLCRLVEKHHAWVKLSAPYRFGLGGPPYEALASYTRTLVSVGSKQLVWGSDWPHPKAPESPPSISTALTQLAEWVNDDDHVKDILVKNPERLYDFPPGD